MTFNDTLKIIFLVKMAIDNDEATPKEEIYNDLIMIQKTNISRIIESDHTAGTQLTNSSSFAARTLSGFRSNLIIIKTSSSIL